MRIGLAEWAAVLACATAPPVSAVPSYVATPLGALGGIHSYGSGINNSGQVTGSSDLTCEGLVPRAFLYSDGRMIDLGTLGCTPTFCPSGGCASGLGINDRGQITGASGIGGAAGGVHAFLHSDGRMLDPVAGPSASNYQGLWWNAPAGSESGWGINFAHQSDIIFAT